MNSEVRAALRCRFVCFLESAFLALSVVFTLAPAQAESPNISLKRPNVGTLVVYDGLGILAVPERASLVKWWSTGLPKFPSNRPRSRQFLAGAWPSENVAAHWEMICDVAVVGLILSAVQISSRLPFSKRLQALSATTTRISHRRDKALRRLRFRDKLGELAAAFDGLAETLREKESPPQNDKAAFKDPAEWLATLSRFNRTLRACPDLPSIERVLVETVEEVFSTCAMELCFNDKSKGIALLGRYHLAEELLAAETQLNPTGEPSARTESWMLPQDRNVFCRPKAESLSKQGWISYVTVPLLAHGEALGALSVYGRERGGLSSLDLDFLNILADQAALAIDKLRFIEQTVQLRHANEALAKSNGAKSDFVSILSHEFRTPLNLIMGYTEMMHEELMGKITAEQGKCLERITKASDDLLALVMNLLQVGNIESGCVEITQTKVGVSQLLREIQSDFVLPQEKKLKLIWDIPPDLPIISTDAEKLKHVLQQLIGNAIKFTERGHVMVSSRSVLPAGKVEIAVSDTGVGIPEHVLSVLFEKYRQLDSSIARSYDGMGLGLFIAKKLTEALGAELNVTSHPGIGSTFTVALPLGI